MIVKKDKIKIVTNKSNRLIYADKAIYNDEFIALINGTEKSKTCTIHNVGEFADKKAAIDFVKEKKWEIPKE